MREAGRRGKKIPQVPLRGGKQGDAVTHHILTYKHRYYLLEINCSGFAQIHSFRISIDMDLGGFARICFVCVPLSIGQAMIYDVVSLRPFLSDRFFMLLRVFGNGCR